MHIRIHLVMIVALHTHTRACCKHFLQHYCF